MSHFLTFIDGATYGSLWSVGPILVSCLRQEEMDPVAISRPTSSDQALGLMTTLFNPILSHDLKETDNVKVIWKSIPTRMAFVMVAYLAGHTLGSYVGKKSQILHCMQKLCPKRIKTMQPNRVLSLMSSLLISLLTINWGFGIATYSGWVFVRFITAFICGALVSWGNRHLGTTKQNVGELDLQLMEEGQPFTPWHRSDASFSNTQQMPWLNQYWLAGVASAALLSGFMFYLLNRVGPHHKIVAFLVFCGAVVLVDRFMSRYYKANKSSKRSTKDVATFEDAGIVEMTGSSGLVNRKKQSNQMQQSLSLPRARINSLSSVESDVFFDALDDLESGYDDEEANPLIIKHQPRHTQSIKQDNTNQIAIYSNRKVVYSDDSSAYVPVGEKASAIPEGYVTLYGKNALSNYQQTKQWRRQQKIHCIHTRPHTWYPKIKVAYPHHIHGFSKNGMPVIYESPGKMNLKELFRNGCQVDDMIFHYCYLMEYLSNLESVLTEIHSELNDACGDSWQEELAAYAHSKQQRLQFDKVSFGFVVVMDISGASPSLLSGDVMAYLSRAGEINSLHYPGSMRRAIAVQAPRWLGAAWGAIKNVMPASVTVDLISAAKTMEGLKEYIDEDQIPVEYGGKSKFKLGEHPFECGLRKLVETQPAGDIDEDEYSEPETDAYFPIDVKAIHSHDDPGAQRRDNQHVRFKQDISREETQTHVIEWDDLDDDYVLIVATILFILVHMLTGSIELVLPLLLVIPAKQGVGFEARKVGMTIFATCMLVLWLLKRTRLSSRITSITEKSPLSAFRISEILPTTNPYSMNCSDTTVMSFFLL